MALQGEKEAWEKWFIDHEMEAWTWIVWVGFRDCHKVDKEESQSEKGIEQLMLRSRL